MSKETSNVTLIYLHPKVTFLCYCYPSVCSLTTDCSELPHHSIKKVLQHVCVQRIVSISTFRCFQRVSSYIWSNVLVWKKAFLSNPAIFIRTNQSNFGSFIERVASDISRNNGDRHRVSKIFLISCFIRVITLVEK